ncbi:hypothetical protein [Haloferax volcanii]|uniref:hypothetical protein n=1 Tax=Haloferax volcanii TaxID=2246 RepID=UPI00249A749B|nr:hypothetical protein [Haloferax alexandrinus]
MGIFEGLRSLVSGESSNKDGNEEEMKELLEQIADDMDVDAMAEAGFNMDPMPRELSRDEHRDIIHEFYDVTQSQAEKLIDAIITGHREGWGYDKTARHVDQEGLDLPREQIKTIIWNEEAGIMTRFHVRQVQESDVVSGVEWMLPGDGGVSPVCEATAEEIEKQGGSVSVEELQTILFANAQKFEDGTPERVQHWIPHDRCRCTLQKTIG